MLFANTGANETPATEVANVERMATVSLADGLTEMAGPILRRMGRQPNDSTICGLSFVTFQRRQPHLGFARIGTMHGLAIVTKGFLRKPLWVTTRFCAFSPGIAIRMEAYSVNSQAEAAPSEFCGAMLFPHVLNFWK